MNNTGKLAGKVVLVTGGSRGIGKAIALKSASDGANVAIAARSGDPSSEGSVYHAAKEIEAVGGKCLPVVMDLEDEGSIEAAIEATVKRFGALDILVNNAGALFVDNTDDITVAHFDRMQKINVRGTFLASKFAIKHLKKSDWPHIVNICPPINMEPVWFEKQLAYTISKYAMSMTVIGLAEELRPHGIGVNAVWPKAVIWTDGVVSVGGDSEKVRKHCRKTTIVAEAFYATVSQNPKRYSGNLNFDADILEKEGIVDLNQYSEEEGQPLIYCTFLSQKDRKSYEGLELNSLLPHFN